MKKTEKAIKKILFTVFTCAVCLSLASCAFVGSLLSGIFVAATENIYDYIAGYFENPAPDNAVYGSDNDLAVGFNDGAMVAFWDDYGNYEYSLTVSDGAEEKATEYSRGTLQIDLEEMGYGYDDNLTLSLSGKQNGNTVELADYSYSAITAVQYNQYSADMQGGWNDLDGYLATRYELFEIFNYIIIFRPNLQVTTEDGVTYYKTELSMYLGYDYVGLYPEGTTAKDAFSTEIASAVNAYDDSAGYSYSYSLKDNLAECKVMARFVYDFNPYKISDTNQDYVQDTSELQGSEKPHYNYAAAPRTRNFAIDGVENAVAVKSTDQLYFALKRGYRPLCETGSNAEHVYNRMREILASVNADITPDGVKVHYIYDYLVDTVLYDYNFTQSFSTDVTDSGLFLYRCMYMEGVFGLTEQNTFQPSECVAICDGIAKAVLSMCTIEGIPVIKISGTSQGVAHAWNKVRIVENWYLVDATWGNVKKPSGNVEIFTHDYLLKADDSDHVEDKWVAYPKAAKPYTLI